jgi:hypothetical protein
MSLMDAADWEMMRADLTAARADNEVAITILDRATTPAPLRVRIVGTGGQANGADSDAGAETTASVLIKGAADLDIQLGDEFALEGVLYRVIFVDPQRRVRTSAEAKAVQ